MKNSNKGFTLLETLIVTTFVVTTLIYLFIQLSNIKVNYDITFRYNTVPGVYNALNISDYVLSEGYENMANGLSIGNKLYYSITDNTYIDGGSSTYYSNLVSKINAKKIIFTDENVTKLNEYLASTTVTESDKAVFDEELTKFIKKIDFDGIAGVYRVIIEYNDNTFASVKLGDGSIVSLNEWQTWIYLGGYKVSDYTALDTFLSDTTRATAIFNNSAANDYLLLHTALIDSVKAQTNYVSSLVSILLASTDLTNLEKYNTGLPCYLYNKTGNNFYTDVTGGWYLGYGANGGTINTTSSFVITNLANAGWVYAFASTNNKLNLDKYSILVSNIYSTTGQPNYAGFRTGKALAYSAEPGGTTISITTIPNYYNAIYDLTSITDSTPYYIFTGIYSGATSTTSNVTLQYVYIY